MTIAKKIYMTNSCNDCRELTEERCISMMVEYAKIKCKEQREICSRLISGWPTEIKTESEIEDDILNAPEPKF